MAVWPLVTSPPVSDMTGLCVFVSLMRDRPLKQTVVQNNVVKTCVIVQHNFHEILPVVVVYNAEEAAIESRIVICLSNDNSLVVDPAASPRL